jgi:hypothetical protein
MSGPTPSISLKAGDTIPNQTGVPMRIEYTPTPTDSGQICGLIYIFVTDMAKSQTHLDSIHWCVNVNVKPKDAFASTLNTPDRLPCEGTYDTVICITNRATCGEPVTYMSASATTTGVTVGGSWPQTIPPGGTYCFPVHFVAPKQDQDGSFTGDVQIAGDIPFNVHYTIPFTGCLKTTVLKIDTTGKTAISTPRCVTVSDTMAITVLNGIATIKSITMNPTGAYTLNIIGATIPPDRVLNQGDVLQLYVTFNPDAGASGDMTTITIQYLDATNSPQTIVIPVKTTITGSHYNSQLSLSSARTTKIKPDMKDAQDFVITLQGDAVPLSVGVQELQVTMKYNTNILIPKGTQPTLGAGWSAGNPYTVNEATQTLTFSVKPTADLVPGTPIATVTMTAAVSDQTSTNVSVSSGLYNPSDANFERCTLAATSLGDQITVAENLNCTDSLTNVAMQGKLTPADNIQIVPNPAHKASGAAANLSFTAAIDASGAVDIVDMTGKTVAELAHGALSHGEHIYAIPTPNLAEGTYFARIQIGGFTVVRKFVLQKD